MSKATWRIEMRYSLFDNKNDKVPRQGVVNWRGMRDWLLQPHEYVDVPTNPRWTPEEQEAARKKAKDRELISLVSYKEGTTRANENVDLVYGLGIDIDSGARIEELEARWVTPGGKQLAYVAYSSFSHTEAHPRWRVFFPFATPVYASEWPRVWDKMIYHLVGGTTKTGGPADPSARDAARMYYLPACPTSQAHECWNQKQEGEALDPDAYADPPPIRRPRTGEFRPMPEGERVSADKLVNSALDRVISEGGRNNACLWLSCQARDNGYSESEVEDIVMDYARRVPDSNTFTDEEALATVRNAFKRNPREPWQKAERPQYHAPKRNRTAGGVPLGVGVPQNDAVEDIYTALCVDRPCTELGNAERLVIRNMADGVSNIRYCPAIGWLYFDGTRYVPDTLGEITDRMKKTVRSINLEAAFLLRQVAEDESKEQTEATQARVKELMSWAKRSESAKVLEASIRLAQSEPGVPIPAEALDSNPFLLNCQNGTINLRTGEFYEHRPADLLTKVIGTSYRKDAAAPAWKKFLERVIPSEELREYLRLVAGYCLTGSVSEQAMYFLYGSGANGKSTFLRTLLDLTGQYSMQASGELLLDKKGGTDQHELARLKGRRIVATIEVDEGRHMAEGLMKSLSGEDRIVARHLYKDPFEFEPTFKIWLAANHKPVVKGTDNAVWRRIKLIPFMETIPPEERDPDLLTKLRAEYEGILAWAVSGCLDWQKYVRIPEPAIVSATVENYRSESDVIGLFIEECCLLGPKHSIGVTALYEAYKHWMEARSERPRSQMVFDGQIASREGIEKRRLTALRIYEGIALFFNKTEDDFLPSPDGTFL